MPDNLQSRPFRPNPRYCCEKCIFGSGEHSERCKSRTAPNCETCNGTGEVIEMVCYGGPPIERRYYCPDCDGDLTPTATSLDKIDDIIKAAE